MAANTVTTAPTSSFDMVWALVQGSASLPVELLTFDARRDDRSVLCNWATASELNNDYFTVERSADGTRFDDVGEVDAAGNTHSITQYFFRDQAPLSGLSYYRLRQTDFDGTESWSQIVAVWMDDGVPLIVWPNPSSGTLNITGISQKDEVVVMDATGREVARPITSMNGIDVSGLAEGPYTVLVRNGEGLRSARFVKR